MKSFWSWIIDEFIDDWTVIMYVYQSSNFKNVLLFVDETKTSNACFLVA